MEGLLNVVQAAELLSVKKGTIYRWTSRRMIPHYKAGKKLLFSAAQISKWLAEREVRSAE